jgi:hypothetical protein
MARFLKVNDSHNNYLFLRENFAGDIKIERRERGL